MTHGSRKEKVIGRHGVESRGTRGRGLVWLTPAYCCTST